MTTEEGWVSVTDVVTHLRVAKESVYQLVEAKGFPAHRVGRLLRFKLSEVDEWVRRGGRDRFVSDSYSESPAAGANPNQLCSKEMKKSENG